MPEPFLGSLRADGMTVVTYPSKDAVQGHPTQLFFTSPKLLQSEPELVKEMTAALEETLEFADANPDAVKAQITKVLPQLPPEAAEKVQLEEFDTDLRQAKIEQLGSLMQQYGLLEKTADVAGLLP